MNLSIRQTVALTLAGTMVHVASASETQSSFNLGLGGLNPMPDCDATIYTLEYERPLNHTTSLLGRGSKVDYTSDEGKYLEDGDLLGVDIGIRYYPSGRMQGFYTGGSLGYWQGDWTFIQNRNNPVPLEGEADSDSLRVNLDLGYRYPISESNISLMPEINLGKFFSSSSCDYTSPASQVSAKCDEESVVNYYIFAGITVAVAF